MLLPLVLLSLLPGLTDPPVHVWLKGGDDFVPGDHARVQARVAADGYLVVLRADGAGRVRVLFPLDPGDDDFVRGGKTFELRGRGGRETFAVDDADDGGVVLAAYSADPFRFDDFVRGDHWDYRVLGGGSLRDDPEAGLLDIIQRMTGEGHFEYEAAHYTVASRDAYRSRVAYGHPFYEPFYFDQCFSCYGWYRPRTFFGIGLTFGSPYFYDPFYYGPYYDPFCWNDPFCFTGGGGFAFGLGRGRSYPRGGGGRYVVRNGPPFVLRNDRGFGGQPVVAPRPRSRPAEVGSFPRSSLPPRGRDFTPPRSRRGSSSTARAAPPRSKGSAPPARAPAPSSRGRTRRH